MYGSMDYSLKLHGCVWEEAVKDVRAQMGLSEDTRIKIQNLIAPPPNNTYVPFGASLRMCPGVELVKMETSAMIHLLHGIIIVALLLVNEFVNAKNPTNPSDFSINSSIGNATSDASLSPPSKEENRCMA
uniref:Cytochrome P450 716B1-like n=1 Tax=Tanacetum cinerariifolium TaxID=118510 RepID=A0A699GT52_TANCI|nr:cytochrome P450 716B1-like [Tanacetum cinerariifolium]